jgi:predicted ATPase/DNA-binding SARP family transcriptional activator
LVAEIKVLGPIQGIRDDEPVDLGGPTQRKLLASLVARRGEVVPVATLLDDLWGDDPPPSGPQSIQSYVSRLRRALGASVVETRPPGYRLSTAFDIDSLKFLELASTLPPDPETRVAQIEVALRLWSGPPFEGFEHVEFAARRLMETRLDLEEERALLLAASGRSSEAVEALERITANEPLRESAWVALSGVLSRAGRQAEAVRTLDGYRRRLAEIGLEPGPSFAAAQDEAFRAPPISRGSDLPRAETSFVGRLREKEDLRSLLDENRLVTVTGVGGMGKSRLAMETLRDWGDSRVTVVRLAGLLDDPEVAPAVLNAVGGEARGDPLDAVVARLAREPVLLLLDNAEHVIEATAQLASRVLARTESQVLVTSREPLNVLGEVTLTLDPLEASSAIDLYRDRARQVSPDFEAPTATLERLCEELDHMPLAIEMAAARSKALMPEEILTRLSRRYGLLHKPLRGGTGRHRSLDALVDWSYSLLDSSEQRVFERLSVVVGELDVDLATALSGFGAVRPDQVPAALASLVEKSLVTRTPTGGFRILRVLKSYAEHRLEMSGDEQEARVAHARWFGDLATRIGAGLSTADETTWVETANDHVEDIGVALAWSVDTKELDLARMILEGLFDWFYHRHPPSIIGWGELVLPESQGHGVRSVASAWAAIAAVKRGDLDAARELAYTGTDVEGPASRFAWFMTGDVACYQDRLQDAREAFRRQLARASSVGDKIGVVDGVAGETIALAFQGRFDEAEELALDLARMADEVGAPTYRAYARYAMGEAVIDADPERSAELLDEAAVRAESVNNQFIEAMARTTRGSVLARLGRFDEAVRDLRQAADLWDGLVMPGYQWVVVQYLGAILAETGHLPESLRLLSAAEAAGRRAFTAGQAHWADVVGRAESHPHYERLRAEGASLSLERALELALGATRPRR